MQDMHRACREVQKKRDRYNNNKIMEGEARVAAADTDAGHAPSM